MDIEKFGCIEKNGTVRVDLTADQMEPEELERRRWVRSLFEREYWRYVLDDRNYEVLVTIKSRLLSAARDHRLIAYGNLLDGLEFYRPNSSSLYKITNAQRPSVEQRWVTDFLFESLRYLSMLSDRQFGFLASVVAVAKGEERPSDPFFDLAKELRALPPRGNRDKFLRDQRFKAHIYSIKVEPHTVAHP